MANPIKKTGKATVKINGVPFETMKGATLSDPMGFKRNAVVGTETFGFTEEAVPPTIDCQFSHGSGISLQALASLENDTITFECDSGAVYVLRNAWYAEGMAVKAGDGALAVKFQGKKCEELTL